MRDQTVFLIQRVVFGVGVFTACGAWFAFRKQPRRYSWIIAGTVMGTILVAASMSFGLFDSDVPVRLELALAAAALVGLWVFSFSWYNGYRMQSFERARASSTDGKLPEFSVHRVSLTVGKRGARRGWDAFAVSSGFPNDAWRLGPPVLWYYLAANLMPVTWYLLHVFSGIPAIQLVLVAGNVAPVAGMMLSNRVVFAGELHSVDGGRYYQAIEPVAPWIGRIPSPDEALFVYRTRQHVWIAYPCSQRGHHTLLIMSSSEEGLSCAVPVIDEATWSRVRWLGLRIRPRAA